MEVIRYLKAHDMAPDRAAHQSMMTKYGRYKDIQHMANCYVPGFKKSSPIKNKRYFWSCLLYIEAIYQFTGNSPEGYNDKGDIIFWVLANLQGINGGIYDHRVVWEPDSLVSNQSSRQNMFKGVFFILIQWLPLTQLIYLPVRFFIMKSIYLVGCSGSIPATY